MPFCLGSSSKSQKLKNVVVGVEPELSFKNKVRALVVDDNRVNRMIHKTMLNNLGVETLEAENGQEAINLHYLGAAFDLILMDYEMPIMNGPQAARILRGMGVRCKIIGVSGNSRGSDREEFIEAGIDEYHIKPITRPKLISILQELDNI